MKILKFLLLGAMGFASANIHAADESKSTQALDEMGSHYTVEDMDARDNLRKVQDYVKNRATIEEKMAGGTLAIGGDVRFGFDSNTLLHNDVKLVGSGANDDDNVPVPAREFNVAANLNMKYWNQKGNSWGNVRLMFDNEAGSMASYGAPAVAYSSGEDANIALRTAYFGWRPMDMTMTGGNLDLEFGRRRLYDAFDSIVQFGSVFDGVLARYSTGFAGVGNFQAQGAVFVIDQTVNHFGWIGEASLENIANTNLYARYSYVNWDKKGVERFGAANSAALKFRNSQITAGWMVPSEMLKNSWMSLNKVHLFGAYLMNHAAEEINADEGEKAKAWYVGLALGECVKANDWAVNLNYQVVDAQAVLESDVQGVGRFPQSYGVSPYAQNASSGNTNYRGYEVGGRYALTNNMHMFVDWNASKAADIDLGGKHDFKRLRLKMIYSF